MPLLIRTKTCLHLLTLAWVIIWVAAVPLFHTHLPDVTDRSTSYQGLAHTVFSPDLPGEFARFSTTHHGPFSQLSNRVSNSPEVGFVFSAWQVGGPDVLSVSSLLDPPFLSKSVVESHTVHPRTFAFSVSRSPRGPPLMVSL